MFQLGQVMRDKITGFTGVCLGITQYLTGCTHCGLQSKELKDGAPTDWQWFDTTRLDIVEDKLIENGKCGGPQPNAPQN
jgi:hypothetical protein